MKHINGYIAKINKVLENVETTDSSKANQNYSEYRELKVEESFNWMIVILNELYFENNRDGVGTRPGAKVYELIAANFGSFEKWKEDFKACGTEPRGWAVLVFDVTSERVPNNGLDAHSVYGFLNGIPLLVTDVYEHA